jgi:hypothetical protein
MSELTSFTFHLVWECRYQLITCRLESEIDHLWFESLSGMLQQSDVYHEAPGFLLVLPRTADYNGLCFIPDFPSLTLLWDFSYTSELHHARSSERAVAVA